MQALTRVLEGFSNGTNALMTDEYLGADGKPYCKTCNTPRLFVSDDKSIIVRCRCRCQEESYRIAEAQRKAEEKSRRAIEDFNNRSSLSMLGARYKNARFANATITDHNRAIYTKCKNYVINSESMLDNNIGIYIHGDNSSGKTYLTACMCNELLRQGKTCIYTNLATILNEVRRSYDGQGMGESELMRRLQEYDFAFIDDLGKEFIGREHNVKISKWAEEKLFEVINTRYNAEKPTIFSSNFTISQLASVLTLDKAIVERIDEMSTRVLKLEGDDFRATVRTDKSDIARRLGV